MLNNIATTQKVVFSVILTIILVSLHNVFLLEANKKRPKAQGLNNFLSNPWVKKGVEILANEPLEDIAKRRANEKKQSTK